MCIENAGGENRIQDNGYSFQKTKYAQCNAQELNGYSSELFTTQLLWK